MLTDPERRSVVVAAPSRTSGYSDSYGFAVFSRPASITDRLSPADHALLGNCAD